MRSSTSISRRGFLTLAAVVGGAAVVHPTLAVAATGPILKPIPPEWFVPFGTNAEMRWDSVDPRTYLTAQERLFVRNHTSTPVIDAATYALKVFGDGLATARTEADALSFTLADLRSRCRASLTSVHECTGNGRRFFADQQGTPASGTAWSLGAVGTVRWEGVWLRDLLASVGLDPDALSIQATGLDDPYVTGGVDYGRVRRPFPVDKALDDAFLAWGADGAPLLPDHGYPLRLVLPGWVGIASIKWLGSLEVSTSQLTSPWNTKWYRMTGGAFPVDSPPLTVNPVRSALELAWDAAIPARPTRLTGRSWSGAAPIRRVEVSVDGGRSWRPAVLDRRGRDDQGWTQWSYQWARPRPGRQEVWARATDEAGRTQPLVAAYNDNGYFFDAVVRHPVRVA
ncbi:molybdopterin-dependent oxidoreductase [Nocardioides currus]|uniref:Sulfite oxidase n=1 Tax=Nocardioides currus TaxID=2133958 RepID=A0A2R7YVV6_9ACTN|nr:molybdopterin-dependent oxidoreductase [Nocardioides currus]PUA80461.1 sulfite oxidase [Nocardioides currus]